MLEARFFQGLLQAPTIAGLAPEWALSLFFLNYAYLIVAGLSFRHVVLAAAFDLPAYLAGSALTQRDPQLLGTLRASLLTNRYFQPIGDHGAPTPLAR